MGVVEGANLMEVTLREEVHALIENWPEVAHHSAHRLRTESAAQGGVKELDEFADALAMVPMPQSPPTGPVLPTTYRCRRDASVAIFNNCAVWNARGSDARRLEDRAILSKQRINRASAPETG